LAPKQQMVPYDLKGALPPTPAPQRL
jgi:hypothetical protein